MASITIRDLDEKLKARLKVRAAEHSRSMENEARDILRLALAGAATTTARLGLSIHERFRSLGGVELPISSREPMHDPPDLGD